MKTKTILRLILLLAATGLCVMGALSSGCAHKTSSLSPTEGAYYGGGAYGGTAPPWMSPGGRNLAVPGQPASTRDSSELAKIQSSGPSVQELWVIARSAGPTAQRAEDEVGSGALMAKEGEKEIPMPLKHTDVKASVNGYIGSVEVIQQFHNPYSRKIEAVYVFP
jgi:hypothetical protein